MSAARFSPNQLDPPVAVGVDPVEGGVAKQFEFVEQWLHQGQVLNLGRQQADVTDAGIPGLDALVGGDNVGAV